MTLPRQRIGYIDALRGLIMLLVVMTHVHRHSFGGAGFSFNSLISAELMPFFFFISGLLLGRRTENGTPGVKGLAKYTGKKILTLCVPAFVFIGIYAFLFRISYIDILWDAYKYGFWFTIVLAAFYLFWALLRLLFEKLCKIKKETAVWIYLCAGVLVFLGTSFIRSPFFPWKNVALNNLLCVYHLQHFLYFTVGLLAGSYSDRFLKLLQNQYVLFAAVCLYTVCITIRYFTSDLLLEALLNPVIALAFIVMLWSLFKKGEERLLTSKVGKTLSYIGKYTLDIYLLHTILLPFNLRMVGDFFDKYPAPVLEFALSFIVAGAIVAVCLLISKLVRTSDFAAKILFGNA